MKGKHRKLVRWVVKRIMEGNGTSVWVTSEAQKDALLAEVTALLLEESEDELRDMALLDVTVNTEPEGVSMMSVALEGAALAVEGFGDATRSLEEFMAAADQEL